MNLLTTREFAARIGVVPKTVRRWVADGRIRPAGRTPTGHLRFAPAQVEEALAGPRPSGRAHDLAVHVQSALARFERRRDQRKQIG